MGVEKTEARFVNQFYWPNIHAKIAEFIQHCHECAIRKPSPVNTTAPLQPIKTTRPLQCAELDFCGLFTQTFDGKKYILTVVDHYTKYAQAYATERCDVDTVVKCIEKYCCTLGVMEKILTDNGKCFIANFFKTFSIFKQHSTTYHSQTQGLVEKFNHTITKILASYTGLDQKIGLITSIYVYLHIIHQFIKHNSYSA